MGILTNLFLSTILVAVKAASHQTYPGTLNRPILSETEAATLTEAHYLQGWNVQPITIPKIPDFVVGEGQYFIDIQAAVNAAINEGGTSRKYIEIRPGSYAQTVFINGNVPLTIYGSGSTPSEVTIFLSQGASLNISDWNNQVNPNGSRYQPNDPTYSMFKQWTSRTGAKDTSRKSIFWITSSNAQVYNLQVINPNVEIGNDQAIALQINADKVHLSNVNLFSKQHTLYAGPGQQGVLQRVYIDNSFIEGDIDFVIGGASVIFSQTTFNAVSPRHTSIAVVFAPNTHPTNSFGFLVTNSTITGDSIVNSTKVLKLARSWDTNTAAGEYVAGTSPNGQLTIINSLIDYVLNVDAPYTASTSSRAHSGNNAISRDLDDNNYNRFWEYKNIGGGA